MYRQVVGGVTMMQELVKSIKDIVQKSIEDMHTAIPAIIISYDAASGLAVVQPKGKFKKPNGDKIDYPSVSGVPVLFPQSGNVIIAFPIKAGDNCLLVFGEQSLDYWMYDKETDTDLKFDLSNAMAIPNLATTGNDVMQEACNEDAVILKSYGTKLKVKGDGVYIEGNVKVTGKIEATNIIKSDVDVTASGISLTKHIHTGDSGGSTGAPH